LHNDGKEIQAGPDAVTEIVRVRGRFYGPAPAQDLPEHGIAFEHDPKHNVQRFPIMVVKRGGLLGIVSTE
jgi:hypothetical protein